jgi:hypothetical protein
LSTWNRRADYVGCVICAALFATAKAQHSLLAIPVALLLWTSRPPWLGRTAAGLAAAAIIAAAAIPRLVAPGAYGPGAVYDVIFYEILPDSKNPDQDLNELGLDSTYRPWIGTYQFNVGVPIAKEEFAREFSRHTSHLRIGWFFLRHPSRAYRTVRKGLNYADRMRVVVGNFDRSAGVPELSESRAFSFWSTLKQRLFEDRGARYLFYFLALCAVLCTSLIGRSRYLLSAGVFLCLMALMSLGIAAFGDALDFTRHFFFFNALTDMILVSGIVALLARLDDQISRPQANVFSDNIRT